MKHFYLFLPLLILISCQDNKSPSTESSAQQASTPVEKNFVNIFKNDGATQCQSTAITLNTMASELVNTGIDVVCSQKAFDGKRHTLSCGAATGAINVFKINKANIEDIASLGYRLVSNLINSTVEACDTTETPRPVQYQKVYKRDIAAQCEGQVVSPESMARELMAMGVAVSCTQKSSDGLFYPAVCGGQSDSINVFRIDTKDILKAKISGFRPVSELANYVDSACTPKFEKVYKPYIDVQCGGPEIFGAKIPNNNLDVVGQELIDAGIAVNCSQRNTDGNSASVVIAVCGALIKGINVFEIPKYSVTNAMALGFSPVSVLPKYRDIACQ